MFLRLRKSQACQLFYCLILHDASPISIPRYGDFHGMELGIPHRNVVFPAGVSEALYRKPN